MFAVNHENIRKRWLYHFKVALKYQQFSLYVKSVAAGDQVVEFMDDEKGQAILHKRKLPETPSIKSRNSIMDLKAEVTP